LTHLNIDRQLRLGLNGGDALSDRNASESSGRNGALSVLAYNLTWVMNIIGIKPLITAIAT
jgi:hypothetical protein